MDSTLNGASGAELAGREFSVAMPEAIHAELSAHFGAHLAEGSLQEDLAFAFWRPSHGRTRTTAVLHRIVFPEPGERILQGNAAFTPEYVQRVLLLAKSGEGIAFAHSHFGPGWQGMSPDDVIAERDRLASAVAGRTGLPLIGLTWGTDGAWSARFWVRQSAKDFMRRDMAAVRVAGRRLRLTFHPRLLPPPMSSPAQVATVSVWGAAHQADLARIRVGIVGLGSVGSIVAEAFSRIGVSRFALIDPDRIEERNLDRTLGAVREDADARIPKVMVAARQLHASHTAEQLVVEPFVGSLLTREGLSRALDCDVLVSCVDRPAPRHLLNAIAYAHLIPVIDGGILARVDAKGALIHADWRIHTVGSGYSCLVCTGALRPEDIALDQAGKLDDPAYIQGLESAFNPLLARQNVFPFSLSVAAHEALQFVGLITGETRVGGTGAQAYHCYPGAMDVVPNDSCAPSCEYFGLIASAADLSANCVPW